MRISCGVIAADTHCHLADVHARRHQQAEAPTNAHLALEEDEVAYTGIYDRHTIMSTTNLGILASQTESFDARIGLVNTLLAGGRLEESVDQFRLLINEQPLNPDIFSAFGDTLQLMRRSEEAETVYRQLVVIDPRDVRGHNGIVEACLSQSKLREAEDACIAVLRLNADDVQGLANLGSILQAKGNIDGALANLQRAVLLAPDNAAVQYKYSSALLASGNAGRAIVHCRKAIELNPDFVEGQSALASIHELEGEYDRAWDILQSLIDSGNRSPHILIAYASLAHRYDQLPKSIAFLEELIARNQLPRVTLTQVYHQLGEPL